MAARANRPIALLLGSNMVATAAGGVFFLAASWEFSLADMGLYVLAISIQWLLVGLVGTGMGVAVVRLSVERLEQNDEPGAGGLALMSAATAATVSLFFGVLGVLGARIGLGAPFTATTAALVALWAGGRVVLECLRSSILAREQYRRAAALTISGAAAGLTALAGVMLTGSLTIERILVAHAIGQVVSAVLASGFLVPLWKARPVLSTVLYRSLLSYAKWPTLGEGAKLVQSHVGPLILVMVSTAEQAGLYGLGRYPAFVFGVVGMSLYQYWLPQAALYGSSHRIGTFLRKHLRLAALTAIGMVAGAVLVTPLLPLLGENLGAGAPLMLPNAIDFALVVTILPIEASFHGMRRPQLDTYVRLARIPILLALAVLLSSKFGAMGMVWSQVITAASALLIAYGVLGKYSSVQAGSPAGSPRASD
jgi:O-antigen/teichoic acid export membrane protein